MGHDELARLAEEGLVPGDELSMPQSPDSSGGKARASGWEVSWLIRLVPSAMPRSASRYKRHASSGDLKSLAQEPPSGHHMRLLKDADRSRSPRLRRCMSVPNQSEAAAAAELPLILNFPGGGKFFYWQSGVATYLNRHFDLSQIKLVGASAGSLTAVLMACEVDAHHAATVAVQMLKRHGVYERPMGLVGVWGLVVRDWLMEILPIDAAQRCSGRVHISVLKLPYRREHVSRFESKEDLVAACMASSHLPLVMDGKPVYMWRGWPCVDGSIMAARRELPRSLSRGESMTFDYMDDADLMAGDMDFMKLSEPSTLFTLIDHGYRYAEKLHASDRLPLALTHRRRFSEPLPLEIPEPPLTDSPTKHRRRTSAGI